MNAQDQTTSEMLALCTDVMNAMSNYALENNVDIEDTTADILCEAEHPQVVVTIPKYISQDDRENLERLAFEAALQSPLQPSLEFVYEQTAG